MIDCIFLSHSCALWGLISIIPWISLPFLTIPLLPLVLCFSDNLFINLFFLSQVSWFYLYKYPPSDFTKPLPVSLFCFVVCFVVFVTLCPFYPSVHHSHSSRPTISFIHVHGTKGWWRSRGERRRGWWRRRQWRCAVVVMDEYMLRH